VSINDEWIDKKQYSQIEYYSVLKGKEIFQYATTYMNCEDILLSETSESQNDKKFT
jgi:hypothetical protein